MRGPPHEAEAAAQGQVQYHKAVCGALVDYDCALSKSPTATEFSVPIPALHLDRCHLSISDTLQ